MGGTRWPSPSHTCTADREAHPLHLAPTHAPQIITELAVMDVLPEGRGLRVVELAKGVTFAEVQAKTGARLEAAERVGEF